MEALEKYFSNPVMRQSKYSNDFCDSCGGNGDSDDNGHYETCSWLLAKKEFIALQNQLSDLQAAARDYMDLASFPENQYDECYYCKADENQIHAENCKYEKARETLARHLPRGQQESEK